MTTITITHPSELLALVPHQIGFVPEESVVAVSLRRPRGRVGLVARVDLAVLADSHDGPRLAHGLVAHLERDHAGSAVVVVYTAADPRGTDHAAHEAVRQIRQAADDVFAELPVWVVTRTGYLSYDCCGECCPPGGRPLAELSSSAVGVRMVVAGSAVAHRREDVATITPATGAERQAVARVCARWAARGAQAACDGAEVLERWRMDSVQAWYDEVAQATDYPGAGHGSRLGRVEAGLRDQRVRDAVLAAMLPGTGDLPLRLVLDATTDPASSQGLMAALERVFQVEAAVTPPGPRDAHVRVLEDVVAHGRRDHQAPALTLLALRAWWAGEGARANQLLTRALHDDPDHVMAQLLAQVASSGLVPGWVAAAR
ncbi:MAG: DUF4192 domain-containing protein [Micrococcales bacterium]|nr:DUF4192 domain-containing protein [Micrococcales bacterium]MCL2668853.1 DUF4192 domain-containing protein [Micrococcales bacterium]